MDKVNQYMSPGSIEDFDLSVHSTPATLKYTTSKYKDEQTEQHEEVNHTSSVLQWKIDLQLALWKSYEDGAKPSMPYNLQLSSRHNTSRVPPKTRQAWIKYSIKAANSNHNWIYQSNLY